MQSDRTPRDCNRSSLLVHQEPDATGYPGQVVAVAAAVDVDVAVFDVVAVAADDAVDATVDAAVTAAAYGFESVIEAAESVASLSPP